MNTDDSSQDRWGQAAHPETDDSANPTHDHSPSEDPSRTRGQAGREMLVQLQQMIDTLATSAAPVMREVAAKAAELAAVAGEKAGPLAHRAAGVTEQVGQRLAARSKVLATELRQPRDGETDISDDIPTDSGWTNSEGEASEGWSSESPADSNWPSESRPVESDWSSNQEPKE